MDYYEDELTIINFVRSLTDDIEYIKSVTNLAIKIYYNEYQLGKTVIGLEYQIKIVSYIAILYDYDPSNYQKIYKFLIQLYNKEKADHYINIINSESNIFTIGEFGITIKNIVYDAIKIKQLGKTGYNKLKEKIKNQYKITNENEIFYYIEKYMSNNIALIIHRMKTETGKKLAIKKRSKFYIYHEDCRKALNTIGNV